MEEVEEEVCQEVMAFQALGLRRQQEALDCICTAEEEDQGVGVREV